MIFNSTVYARAESYRKSRNILLSVTLMAIVIHYFLPPRTVTLLPHPSHATELYGYAEKTTGKSAAWINKLDNHWVCDFKETDSYGCGWLVHFYPEEQKTLNLSNYNSLKIHLRYEGPASRMRIFLRNFNPAYSDPTDMSTTKVMTTTFPVNEMANPISIGLSEFAVAHWWLLEQKTRQRWPQRELHSITHVGFDFIERGRHQVEIKKLELVGNWINTETLLIFILCFWMAVFLLEGLVRFFGQYRKAQRNRHMIQVLEQKQHALEEENKYLETLADLDPLTGVLNRAGLRHELDSLHEHRGDFAGLGILLLDIDHFKSLNDQYGHDVGDKVLKAFASVLAVNLRQEDIFARLGGEEFVVVSLHPTSDGLRAFAEKLRQLSRCCTFTSEREWRLSVSIGATLVAPHEDFSVALKRADVALYRAKKNGRNRVEYNEVPR